MQNCLQFPVSHRVILLVNSTSVISQIPRNELNLRICLAILQHFCISRVATKQIVRDFDCEIFELFFWYRRAPAVLMQEVQGGKECGSLVGVMKGVVLNKPKEKRCANVKAIGPLQPSIERDALSAYRRFQKINVARTDTTESFTD